MTIASPPGSALKYGMGFSLSPGGIAPPAPVVLFPATAPRVPLLFVSAHSGRFYPESFLQASRLDPQTLRCSEDGLVDELFARAPSLGAPLLTATFPRAFCDANRAPWELDPDMFEDPLPPWVDTLSPRVLSGLGTIARIVASGKPIYRRKLRFAEAERRVREYWEPFHAALGAALQATQEKFGRCLLGDCHSMPAGYVAPAKSADFVLGDAYGQSCRIETTRLAMEALRGMGYRVHRNVPYAGGYITSHYGRPREGIQALQIEISRGLYLDEVSREPLGSRARLEENLTRLIEALARLVEMDEF